VGERRNKSDIFKNWSNRSRRRRSVNDGESRKKLRRVLL
jgi:hypothetical protein